MADVVRSQAEADGMAFGYLGVVIRGTDVWTTGRGTPNRRLGPLSGACAGVIEPRRSWIGSYERQLLPWVRVDEWPRIAGQIGRFNAAAYLAPPP